MKSLMEYRAPLLLTAVAIVFFILQIAFPVFESALILDSSQVLTSPWRLVTAIFLHGDLTHLFYNILALVLFGLILEQIIGRKRFYVLFFAGGIVASVAAALLYPFSLGASGAVFAVLGCLAVLRPRMTVWVYFFPMPMAAAAVLWFLIDMVGLIAPSGIANAAHIAGLVFGVLFGLVIKRRHEDHGYKFIYKRGKLLTEEDVDEWEDRYVGK
jgi:hypothetical protein